LVDARQMFRASLTHGQDALEETFERAMALLGRRWSRASALRPAALLVSAGIGPLGHDQGALSLTPVFRSPFTGALRQWPFVDHDIVMEQNGALGVFEARQRGIVQVDVLVLRGERLGPESLGFEQHVHGRLARDQLFESSPQLLPVGLALRALD